MTELVVVRELRRLIAHQHRREGGGSGPIAVYRKQMNQLDHYDLLTENAGRRYFEGVEVIPYSEAAPEDDG